MIPNDAAAGADRNDGGRHADSPSTNLLAAEAWFRRRGLPWFVDAVDARVRALLRRRWLWILLAVAAAVAVTSTWAAHLITDHWPSAALLGLGVAGVVLVTYAGGPLRVAVIAQWAAAARSPNWT
jgi:hypothetical protein